MPVLTRRQCFCCVAGSLVLCVAMISLALFVWINNKGDKTAIETMDQLLLISGLSTVWCKSVTVTSADGTLRFNASVVPGKPNLDPGHKQTSKESLTLFVPARGSYVLRYFLPATSAIHILQCATQPGLMSYIFMGKFVDDQCLKMADQRLPWFHEDFDTEDVAHKQRIWRDPCAQITLQRFLVKVCRGTEAKLQPMDANIAEDDYYLIYYLGSVADANVTMKLTLTRPTYDLSDELHNCTDVTECTLPYRWGLGDTVVVQTGLGSGPSGQHELQWVCNPNLIAYGIIFVAVPVFLIMLAQMVVFCCRRRRRKKISERQPLLVGNGGGDEEVEERDTRQVESLQQDNKRYGAIGDDRIEEFVPRPSYDTRPSAPSVQPFVEDSMVPPFYPREPPPPYQESPPSTQPKVDKRGPLVEEC